MSNAAARVRQSPERASAPAEPRADAVDTTLLDLVQAVSETTSNDHEVVGTILHMIRSGSVRLRGIFRDEPKEQF